MVKILLIRHALTDTAGKILSGRSPGIFLNEEGRLQAQHLAEKLSELSLSAIICSPLERALETGKFIAEYQNLSCQTSVDFIEIDFGDWTNLQVRELKEDPTFQYFNTFRSGTCIPGGELILEAQLRMVHGIEKICSEYQEKSIAVVTHADMIRLLIAYYTGIPLDMISRIEISPASVSVLELFKDTSRITLINGNTAHFG